jgi:hypothetical protein
MPWILLALLALALGVGYTVLINAGPTRCPECRRVNALRRARTGARQDERDDEGDLRRSWTEVACGLCGRRYWLVWDDLAGRAATLAPPPNAAGPRGS